MLEHFVLCNSAACRALRWKIASLSAFRSSALVDNPTICSSYKRETAPRRKWEWETPEVGRHHWVQPLAVAAAKAPEMLR